MSKHVHASPRSMPSETNVSTPERMLTGVGGALLALAGWRRGGVGGLLGALAGGALVARAASGHCPAYARLGSSSAERQLAQRHGWHTAAVARESIVIDRPRQALYAFWRDFGNLSRVMSHVERVDVLDDTRSHWVIGLPAGATLEWNSTITEDRSGQRIAWQSAPDAGLRNAGWVEFRDAPGGATELVVELAYEPPAGELGRSLLNLWPRAPGAVLRGDLEQLRRRIENGELVLTTQAPSPLSTTSDAPVQRH